MSETKSRGPITQQQEDLLLELFLQLSIDDRVKVIKLCRDLVRVSQEAHVEH